MESRAWGCIGENPTYQLPVGHRVRSTHEPGIPEWSQAVQAAPFALLLEWNEPRLIGICGHKFDGTDRMVPLL